MLSHVFGLDIAHLTLSGWAGPSLELACHFGLVLAVEIAIFVPLGPWISAWKGPKWPKVSLSHA